MKVYISADIEGMAAICDWEESKKSGMDYRYFQEQMTAEVVAACEGAIKAGAKEIFVKDAHGSGRNIIPDKLPQCAVLSRGWSGHPFSMMAEINNTFAAALFIGYHSRAGSLGNPLSHTFSGYVCLKLNEELVSEFRLNNYIAALVGVPVVFLSGDKALCEEVKSFDERIGTFSTKDGIGNSVISIHPQKAIDGIRQGVEQSLKGDFRKVLKPLPSRFKLDVHYRKPTSAYRNSFYPGAKLVGEDRVVFEAQDFFEVMRFLSFQINN